MLWLYIFVVVVKDGGRFVFIGMVRVEVIFGNVNDNLLWFLKLMYNEYVNEDVGLGELVIIGMI